MTRMRQLIIKFDTYKKHPNHTISKHFNKMSMIIGELKVIGYVLIDEQQVQAMIYSLSNSQKDIKLNLTHNDNIKTFADIAQHVELKEQCLIFERGTKKVFLVGTGSKESSSSKNEDKDRIWKEKSKKVKDIARGPQKNFKGNNKG